MVLGALFASRCRLEARSPHLRDDLGEPLLVFVEGVAVATATTIRDEFEDVRRFFMEGFAAEATECTLSVAPDSESALGVAPGWYGARTCRTWPLFGRAALILVIFARKSHLVRSTWRGRMSASHISVAHAKAKFSALLEGVFHRGERYVIERHGREVAAIVSPSELRRLEQARPLAERPSGAMALVGLWQDLSDDEIDRLLADLRAARDRDTGRHVGLGA